MTAFDKEHISFTTDFNRIDLTKDAPIKSSGVDINSCFSVCKQYPSAELKVERAKMAA
tara:strand:- start:461 stop:634 length:174 start_codon:yes stop_codon:yes gene_type:complete